MIFVTVGHKDFDRLIKKMDEIANKPDQEIIMQIGDKPKFFPKNTKYFRFVTRKEIEDYFRKANLIISHCSTGAIMNARKYSKPIIMVTRDYRLGEHVDDHQIQLAKMLERDKLMKGVYIIYDLDMLEQTIKIALNSTPKFTESIGKERLICIIRDFISMNCS